MASPDGSFTLGEIADFLELDCDQESNLPLIGIASLQEANRDQLSFLFDHRYHRYLAQTTAGAVILAPEYAAQCPVPTLVCEEPRMAFARITALFDDARRPEAGIDVSARVSDSARLGESVYVGPNTVIGDNVYIGDGVVIDAGCFIDRNCRIESATRLWPNVTLYHGCRIGRRCVLHAGAVIGADGFGFDFDHSAGRMVKIHQVYGVRIGDDVEIGANSTVDRGALNDTEIGNGVKLDNQVQVGHGTRIGDHTAISGCTGIAGSVRIGSYCLIGGGVGIINNLEITDQVEITAMTLVSQSILEPGRYSSGTGLSNSSKWKRNIVTFNKLDELQRRLRILERRISPDEHG